MLDGWVEFGELLDRQLERGGEALGGGLIVEKEAVGPTGGAEEKGLGSEFFLSAGGEVFRDAVEEPNEFEVVEAVGFEEVPGA